MNYIDLFETEPVFGMLVIYHEESNMVQLDNIWIETSPKIVATEPESWNDILIDALNYDNECYFVK